MWSRASSGATRCQVVCVRGWPCRSTTGGPEPPCRTRSTASPTSTRSSVKPSNMSTTYTVHDSRKREWKKLIAHARIEERVHDVHDEVHQHDRHRADQNRPLHHRQVALLDRVEGEA